MSSAGKWRPNESYVLYLFGMHDHLISYYWLTKTKAGLPLPERVLYFIFCSPLFKWLAQKTTFVLLHHTLTVGTEKDSFQNSQPPLLYIHHLLLDQSKNFLFLKKYIWNRSIIWLLLINKIKIHKTVKKTMIYAQTCTMYI